MRLLVVDDNEQNRYMLQVLLEGHGYQVASAGNGVEALEVARRAPPDMIISDILMPVMDGFALCREWKKDEGLKAIPFVFYTATYTDPKDEEFALSLGAERFIIKPQEPDVFMEMVRDVFENYETDRPVALREPVEEEAVFFRGYNDALIRKLEEKLVQLEEANRTLEREITERKQAEEVLRESEEKYRALFEHLPIPAFTKNREGEYTSCNVENQKYWAVNPIGRTDAELLDPETAAALREADLHVIETGDTLTVEEHLVNTPLGERQVLSRKVPLRDGSGNIVGILGASLDITERARAEKALQMAEKEKENILDAQLEHVIYTDTEMRILWPNKAACDSVNMSREELIGRHCYEIWPQRDEPCEDCPVIASIKMGQPQSIEKTTSDGRSWFIRSYPVRDVEGEIVGAIEVTQEITERKRAEEALRESEERFSLFMDYLPAVVFIKDEKSKALYVNKYMKDVLGAKDWIGKTVLELFPKDFAEAMIADDKKALTRGYQLIIETIPDKHGINHIYQTRKFRIERSGKPPLLGGIALDITERKRAEEALRESQAQFQDLYDNAPNAYFSVGADGHIRHCNRRAGELLGYPLQELVGRPALELYAGTPQGKEKAARLFEQFQAGEVIHDETLQMQKADGSAVWISLTVNAVRDAQGQILESRSMVVDISARVRVEEALRESEERYRSFVQNFQGIAFRGRMDFTPIFFHGAVEEITGYTEREFLDGKPRWDQVIHPEDLPALFTEDEERLLSIPHYSYEREYRIVRKDGAVRWVHEVIQNVCDDSGKPALLQGAIYDITERKWAEEELNHYQDHLEDLVQERTRELGEAQAELVRKERLSALGQLTATVAHEIRNPLGTVRTCVFAISDAIERDATNRVESALQIAERNIVRCDTIISELLDYSRDRVLQLQSTPVDTWLETLLDEQTMTQDIVCVRELTSGVKVSLDREHLRRAVVNVVENAIQAMQEQASQEHQLTVCTRVAGDGSSLEIEVRDTGPGIPDDVLPRIFEPLFSTKSYGVGLGLSVVKNIMEQHGGGVSLQSQAADDEQPGGTSVVLWLPIDLEGAK